MQDLIYMTVGHNIDYVKLWGLCMDSIYKQGEYTQDVLVYHPSNVDFRETLASMAGPGKVNYEVYDGMSKINAARQKLAIYDYKSICNYDRVLYLDCDILITNNLNRIFDAVENKISVSNDDPQSLMTHEYWGGNLFNDKEKSDIVTSNILGINSGVFCFRILDCNLSTLKLAYERTITYGQECSVCLEQPAFNYALYKNKNYDMILQNFVIHRNRYHNLETLTSNTLGEYKEKGYVALHFCGGPGNFLDKYSAMQKASILL